MTRNIHLDRNAQYTIHTGQDIDKGFLLVAGKRSYLVRGFPDGTVNIHGMRYTGYGKLVVLPGDDHVQIRYSS